MLDLHLHTTASDGQYAPQELVLLAQSSGLNIIAVTDHDTVEGIAPAMAAAQKTQTRVIAGIELGAAQGDQLHLLGYHIDTTDSVLCDLCAWMREQRDSRKHRIAGYLQGLGLDITVAQVEQLAGGAVIGRPHFAQLLLQKGYVSEMREAFERYLATPEFAKIERVKPLASQCIAAIRHAGGIAVLAHPALLALQDAELEQLIEQLTADGLQGIECYYSTHTLAQQSFYLALAQRYGLYVTAGSDFHGERIKPTVALGSWEDGCVTLPLV